MHIDPICKDVMEYKWDGNSFKTGARWIASLHALKLSIGSKMQIIRVFIFDLNFLPLNDRNLIDRAMGCSFGIYSEKGWNLV